MQVQHFKAFMLCRMGWEDRFRARKLGNLQLDESHKPQSSLTDSKSYLKVIEGASLLADPDAIFHGSTISNACFIHPFWNSQSLLDMFVACSIVFPIDCWSLDEFMNHFVRDISSESAPQLSVGLVNLWQRIPGSFSHAHMKDWFVQLLQLAESRSTCTLLEFAQSFTEHEVSLLSSRRVVAVVRNVLEHPDDPALCYALAAVSQYLRLKPLECIAVFCQSFLEHSCFIWSLIARYADLPLSQKSKPVP
jgi:hypothetical protein